MATDIHQSVGGVHCHPTEQKAANSSDTEAPGSPMPARGDNALVSTDSQAGGQQAEVGNCHETPRPTGDASRLHLKSSNRITPKGTQPFSKQKEKFQQPTDGKSTISGFVLSADAPAYTPQTTVAKQLQGLSSSHLTEPSGLGFIRTFSSPAALLKKGESVQKKAWASNAEDAAAAPTKNLGLLTERCVETDEFPSLEQQLHAPSSFGSKKIAGNLTVLTNNPSLPLKFCKFLIGEDVAGFLVGRKGVGIEEFQSRNGPGLKVSVSKRGELFPCLLERIATAVGVGDGLARAVVEVSRVALDRAMHKEEERRIDNGKKISKPRGCFKLVVPESALTHIFTPDAEGRVPVVEVAKKHKVEILSSAQGGYLHNRLHPLGLKETVLQIIGTADAVPGAAVALSSLYQNDPSLPSCLHLNYSLAHFAATPPPPPTPPPSPALSSGCLPRLSPHFDHPAGVLQLTSGQQQQHLSNSSWGLTPQGDPLLHALRASAGSQASMLCMPSALASSDGSAPGPHMLQGGRVGTAQMQLGGQGASCLLSGSSRGLRGSRNGGAETLANTTSSLSEDRLVSELQQQLGAAAAAAAAAGTAQQLHHQLVPSLPSSAPSLGWQQQQQQQHQTHAGAASEWPDLQLLTQLCMAAPQRPGLSQEEQQAKGLLQQLEELQQSLLLQQQQQQPSNQTPSRQAAEPNFLLQSPPAPSGQQYLQQIQQQLQLLHARQQHNSQQFYSGPAAASSFPPHGAVDEQQKLLALMKQLQQQLQQQLLHWQQQQRQQQQQQQKFQVAEVGGQQQEAAAWPEKEFAQLQRMALRRQHPGVHTDKIENLQAELLHSHPHETSQGTQLLSPVPPPQWAQMPQLQQQQLLQQREFRVSFGSSQYSPSGASEGSHAQAFYPTPQQQQQQQLSASLHADGGGPLPLTPKAQLLGGGFSAWMQPAAGVDGALYASAPGIDGALQASAAGHSGQEPCESLLTHKLLEELLNILGPSAAMGAPSALGQGGQQPAAARLFSTNEAQSLKATKNTQEERGEGGWIAAVQHAEKTQQEQFQQQQQQQQEQHQSHHRRRRGDVPSANKVETASLKRGAALRPKASSHQAQPSVA